jgi:fatty acid/phospholipid biosynthesis enzyme
MRCRRPAESQNRVAVRSAITTVTPGASAAVISAGTSAALVVSISPGRLTTAVVGDDRS